jgi:tetraacyldisaccharide 4'-kinase
MQALAGRRFFAFAGIGNPYGFEKQLQAVGGEMVGRRWLADHWDYSHHDIARINEEARRAGAESLVTSEKDWVKVARVVDERTSLPIWRVEMAVRFLGDDERKLFELIRARLRSGQK